MREMVYQARWWQVQGSRTRLGKRCGCRWHVKSERRGEAGCVGCADGGKDSGFTLRWEPPEGFKPRADMITLAMTDCGSGETR